MPADLESTYVSGDFGYSLKDEIKYAKTKLGKPGFKLVGALEKVLHAAFLDTQARTHVITGSLRDSGKVSSDFDGEDWHGRIVYGGVSGGPNNPVDYAIYEMARGGSHDFFNGLPGFYPEFEAAITTHLVQD